MNKQTIFSALANDLDNSALGIICSELEAQGYEVTMEGQKVSANEFWDGSLSELETKLSISLELVGPEQTVEKYLMEFVEFHEVIISDIS